MKIAIIALALLGACGMSDLGPGDDCDVTLSYTPANPVTGNMVRVNSVATNVFGAPSYTWSVTRSGIDIPFTFAQTNNSAIEFVADVAGIYEVESEVSPSSNGSSGHPPPA